MCLLSYVCYIKNHTRGSASDLPITYLVCKFSDKFAYLLYTLYVTHHLIFKRENSVFLRAM